jgi:hypothetical protein
LIADLKAAAFIKAQLLFFGAAIQNGGKNGKV